MLKRITILVTIALALPVALAAQDTIDEVLQCYYENIGGLEAWQALDAARMSGTMTLAPGMEAPFTVLNARPNLVRIEFTFQGMTGTRAFDGETGWQVMPFMGSTDPEPLPEAQVEALRDDSDLDGPLIGWEEDGIELELLEPGDVEGTPAHRIRVTRPDGDEQIYFLDADYCVPLKVEAEQEVQGQTLQITTVMGDYKDVNGLMMAHSIETQSPMMPAPQVMTIESVELNPEYDSSTFTMPESEGGDEGGGTDR